MRLSKILKQIGVPNAKCLRNMGFDSLYLSDSKFAFEANAAFGSEAIKDVSDDALYALIQKFKDQVRPQKIDIFEMELMRRNYEKVRKHGIRSM